MFYKRDNGLRPLTVDEAIQAQAEIANSPSLRDLSTTLQNLSASGFAYKPRLGLIPLNITHYANLLKWGVREEDVYLFPGDLGIRDKVEELLENLKND